MLVTGPGTRGLFKRCNVWSNSRAGVSVVRRSDPAFVDCRIHDTRKGCSVWVSDEGTIGRFERCELWGGTEAGMAVLRGADPLVTGCT